MKRIQVVLSTTRRLLVGSVALVACAIVVTTTAAAQVPPPIGGLTGTVAPDNTVVQEQAAAHAIIVKTMDGVGHVFHAAKALFVHSGTPRGVDALQGLRDGTTVVVHDTVAESDAPILEIEQIAGKQLAVSEGTVIRVDRGRQEIVIRFDNGKDERLHLVERTGGKSAARSDRASNTAAKVTVYYAEEGGPRVAHYFERMS